jgi:hypothetical protein
MKCNLESHRSLFLHYPSWLPRLVLLRNGGYTPRLIHWLYWRSIPLEHQPDWLLEKTKVSTDWFPRSAWG